MSHEQGQLHAAQAHLRHAVHLVDRGGDVAVRQAREADVPVRIRAAELHQPVVVDPEHLVGRLGVVEPRGRAEDAVDHLGVHAVAVEVLDAQVRIGHALDALLAVVVEAGAGHDVHAMVLARDVLGPRGAHAVQEPERPAVLARPVGPVRTISHVRHARLERRGRARREEVGRHPRKIQVAIGGDPVVFHGVPPSGASGSADYSTALARDGRRAGPSGTRDGPGEFRLSRAWKA